MKVLFKKFFCLLFIASMLVGSSCSECFAGHYVYASVPTLCQPLDWYHNLSHNKKMLWTSAIAAAVSLTCWVFRRYYKKYAAKSSKIARVSTAGMPVSQRKNTGSSNEGEPTISPVVGESNIKIVVGDEREGEFKLMCADKKIVYIGMGSFFDRNEAGPQALPQFMVDSIIKYGNLCKCINLDPTWHSEGTTFLESYINQKIPKSVQEIISNKAEIFLILRDIDYFDISPSLSECSKIVLGNEGVVALADFMDSGAPHTNIYRWYNMLFNQNKDGVIFFEWNNASWDQVSLGISSLTLWYKCRFSQYENRILSARLYFLEEIQKGRPFLTENEIIKKIRKSSNLFEEPSLQNKSRNIDALFDVRYKKKYNKTVREVLDEDYELFRPLYAVSDEDIIRDFWTKPLSCRWAPLNFKLEIEKVKNRFILKDPQIPDINLGNLTEVQKKRFGITQEVDVQLKDSYRKYGASDDGTISQELTSLQTQLAGLATIVS